jgi:uncharacterized protein (DUF3084 family)
MSLYKTFKTVEDIIEYLKDSDNIETLDTGEVTLKDWVELGNSLEKSKRDHKFAQNDTKTFRKKQEEADNKVAELTEQLDLVNSELTSLKESQGGNDKEALQNAIKEKSEAIVQRNKLETKVKELEKSQSRIPELEKEVADYKAATNRSIILEAVKKAAVKCKVPQHIIDDSDFSRIVVDDFAIDETGNILTTDESQLTVENYITARQKEKPHWSASTVPAGNEAMRGNGEGGTMTDEHADIMTNL